jgi:hypothetical protein
MNVVTCGQTPASPTAISKGVYHNSILEVLTFYKSGMWSYCLSVLQDLWYGDFGFHYTLKIKSRNFLMMR